MRAGLTHEQIERVTPLHDNCFDSFWNPFAELMPCNCAFVNDVTEPQPPSETIGPSAAVHQYQPRWRIRFHNEVTRPRSRTARELTPLR